METKNTGSNQGYQFKTKNTGWKPRILDGNQGYWIETNDTGSK